VPGQRRWMVAKLCRVERAAVYGGGAMLPDIRAVIAAMAAAITLLIIAFGVVATLRVAQESRAGSFHADLVQRAHATVPDPRPVVVIETPGPTLLAKTPEIEPLAPAVEQLPAPTESLTMETEQAPQLVAANPDSPPVASVSPEPDSDKMHVAEIRPVTPERALIAAAESEPEPATAPTTIEALLQMAEPQPEPPSPASSIAAIGGPSSEEIAQAKAQRKAAERARARKAAAEKRTKARAARIARERKLAADRAEAQAKQQASASSQPNGLGLAPTGPFGSAPFGNTYNFGGATNQR